MAKDHVASLHKSSQKILNQKVSLFLRNYTTAVSKNNTFLRLKQDSEFVPSGADFKYQLKALPEVHKSTEFQALEAQSSQILHDACIALGKLQLAALDLERKALEKRALKSFCSALYEVCLHFTTEALARTNRVHRMILNILRNMRMISKLHSSSLNSKTF